MNSLRSSPCGKRPPNHVARCVVLPLVVTLLLFVRPAHGTIKLYSDPPSGNPPRPRNDRFYVGADKTFDTAFPYNWSGVGRNTRWGTLISPDYFITANHFTPSLGSTLSFYATNDPNGPVETRKVVSGSQIFALVNGVSTPTDLWLGRLDAPVSSNIAYYPFYKPAHDNTAGALNPNSEYNNQVIYTFGLSVPNDSSAGPTTVRVGRNTVDPSSYDYLTVTSPSSTGWTYRFTYDNPPPTAIGGDESLLQSGDSGGPSFMMVNGAPAVVGVHWAINGSASYDTFVAKYITQLSTAMSAAGELPTVVMPVTAQWSGAGSGKWGGSNNWNAGGVFNDVPGGTQPIWAYVQFDAATASRSTVNLDSTQSVTGMTFTAASGSSGFTLSGTGTLTLGEGGLINRSDRTQTISCPVSLRAGQRWNVGLGGLAVSGNINTGTSTPGNLLLIEGAGNATLSGVVSGLGNLAKDGSGILTLSGVNTYTGQTTVRSGVLAVSSDGNLGAAYDGSLAPLVVVSGGSGYTTAPSVTISAPTAGGTTATANATLSGGGVNGLTLTNNGTGYVANPTVTLGGSGGAVAAAYVKGLLTLDGGTLRTTAAITSSRAIVLTSNGGTIDTGAFNSTISGVLNGTGSLTKTGAGSLTLSAGSTYTGATNVSFGTLEVSGTNGSIAQSSGVTLNQGTLLLNSSAGNNTATGNRLADAAPLTLRDGVFRVLANSGGTTETLGNVTSALGENTYELSGNAFPGPSSTIGNGTLTRTPGATLNFTGTLDPLNVVSFNIPSGFIDQGTFVNGSYYAVYDPLGFVRAMVGGSDASDYAAMVTPNRHVYLSTSATNQSSVTLQTLSLAGPAVDFTLAADQTITLDRGGIVKTGGGTSTISGGSGLSTTAEYVFRTASGQLNVNTAITGGTGLTKAGQGTLVLGNADNSYAGPTTVTAGILKLGVAQAIPAASNLVVTGSGIFDLDTYNQTVAGITLRDGSLQSTGAAALSLAGASGTVTYAGVSIGGNISVNTLNLATGTAAAATHAFSIADGQADVDLTITSVIADGSTNRQGISKSGAGTLRLTGLNAYSGDTTVNAGILRLGASGVIPDGAGKGNVVLNGGAVAGTLDLAGYSETINALQGASGTVLGHVLNSGSGSSVLVVGSGGASGTFAGIVKNNAGGGAGTVALTKIGSGTQTLSGSSLYTGATTISGGVLHANDSAGLPATSPLVLDGGVLELSGPASFTRPLGANGSTAQWTAAGGGFAATGGKLTVNLGNDFRQLTWGSTTGSNLAGTLKFGSVEANAETEFQNPVNLGDSDRTIDVTAGTGGDFATLSGVLSNGTGTAGLMKTGSGTLVLKASNSYGGTTTVSQGTLRYGASDVIGAGPVTVSGGAVDLASYTDTVGTVTLAGGSIVGQSSSLLTTTGSFAAQSGTITANLAGAGPLYKTTTGIVILSGTNTYSGDTTVSAGILQAGANSILPFGASVGNLVISGGSDAANAGTFDLAGFSQSVNGLSGGSGIVPGRVTNSASGALTNTLTVGNNNAGSLFAGQIRDGATAKVALTKVGSGTLVLSGANGYTGATTVSGGVLQANDGVGLPSASFLSLGGILQSDGAASFNRALGASGTTFAWQSDVTGFAANGGKLTVSIGGQGSPSPLAWGTDLLGVLRFGSASANHATELQNPIDLGGADRTIDVTAGAGGDFATLAGALSTSIGTAGLTKTGGGTLVLKAASSYNGATTISDGSVLLGADDVIPYGVSAGNLVLHGGPSAGTFDLAGYRATINALQGAGGAILGQVLNSGSGMSILTVGGGNASGSFAGIIKDNASGGAGTVALTKIGSGTQTLTGGNLYSGATTISGGVLHANDGPGLPVASDLVLDGGVLELSGPASFTRPLGASGSAVQWTATGGGFAATGGKLTVNLGNDLRPLTWSSTVGSNLVGTLKFGSSSADAETEFQNPIDLGGADRTIDVAAGAGGDFATLSGSLTNATGTAGLIKTGTGTLVLNAANSYNGGTTVTDGTLLVSQYDSLPTGYGLSVGAAGTVVLSSGLSLPNEPTASGIGRLSLGSSGSGPAAAAASRPGAASVPEPGTWAMLVGLALGWVVWRGWRRWRTCG